MWLVSPVSIISNAPIILLVITFMINLQIIFITTFQ